MRKSSKWFIFLILVAAIILYGLSGASVAKKQEKNQIMVAMAASLKNAYEELLPLFQAQYPDIEVTAVFDSSGKLQTQIEEGLQADVFLSAATKQMDALVDAGLVKEADVVNLLENQIVLIVPIGNPARLQSFEDLAAASLLAVGDPESVPAGQYAKEALTNLGLWETVSEKASYGTNVTEVLQQVASAGADAGIVYATDAASRAEEVEVIAAAPQGSLAAPVLYPAAKLADSENLQAAQVFVDFLQSPEAQAIFEKYGFTIIR